uniref:Cyanocobalamin reductase / alkylcobalamin dealkylase n=1 Tax=Ciona savignyi TaxID=51511 RepID=H2YQ80_CIOSA
FTFCDMDSHAILSKLRETLNPLGMETYLFKVGWYNDTVIPSFKLPYDNDTLCAVILTIPSFFENAFLPNLSTFFSQSDSKDPIDKCIAHHINSALSNLDINGVEVMYDYEILPNRRPKVLVQTAAHVSGAAFYYQRHHCNSKCLNDHWDKNRRIYGVCIHPKYGGWFAIRAVLVFKDMKDPDLQIQPPTDCVKSRNDRIDLLERFNGNWKDWTYRDIIPVVEKYSELQKLYFITAPKERKHTL